MLFCYPEGFAHSAAAEGSSAGEERQKAIWSYVYAYASAGGDLELRFCIFERRRRFAVTFLHIAASAVIWTYVSACRSVAGEVDEANVAVARVWRTLRSLRRERQTLPFYAGGEPQQHFAQNSYNTQGKRSV